MCELEQDLWIGSFAVMLSYQTTFSLIDGDKI
jgi:hypothetical protein